MSRIAPLVAMTLLAAGPAAAQSAAAPGAQPPVRAQSTQSLASLFSSNDYPAEAIRNYEEGTVAFRLEVGAEGRPTDCLVANSSGSPALDATTCRLLLERARFRSARNAEGEPASDRVLGRIIWRLPLETSRKAFAFALWRGCFLGEAAKYVMEDLPSAEMAQRSFPPCAQLEGLFARISGQQAPLTEPRERLADLVQGLVDDADRLLKAPAPAETGQRK